MALPRVLVVAGTHGNEINAPWLLDQWQRNPALIACPDVIPVPVIGNPEARAQGRRYLDRDLNRSFRFELLARADHQAMASCESSRLDREIVRAHELVSRFGPEGPEGCVVALDLHSTTAAMGSSLVVYGRRPADLALAAAVQQRLGLPVYLHEADQAQQGFLVERWPCGVVIEIGPVPQMLLQASIVEQTRLTLEACLAVIADARRQKLVCPSGLIVHRHLGSLDLPRDPEGRPDACVHPARQGQDWQPLLSGDPLFLKADGSVIPYEGPDGRVPVFINEAAYGEKGIALSITEREVWPLEGAVPEALQMLLADD